jgi:hypothetical protein
MHTGSNEILSTTPGLAKGDASQERANSCRPTQPSQVLFAQVLIDHGVQFRHAQHGWFRGMREEVDEVMWKQ